MYSSASELLRDVQHLSGYDKSDGSHAGSLLNYANDQADSLADAFTNVNRSLSQGWTYAGDFAIEIDNMIKETIDSLIIVMSQFSRDTIDAENKAAKAAETANDKAQDILNKLKSNDSSHVPPNENLKPLGNE